MSGKEEYLMIREEILQYVGEYQSVRNMMYVVSVAILGFNYAENANVYLFLLPLMVILPSYIISVDYWKCVVKASTYLMVFYEEEADTIFHWESRHSRFNKRYNFMAQKYYQHLPYSVCSIVCVVSYLANVICDSLNIINIMLGMFAIGIGIFVFRKYGRVDEQAFINEWQKIKYAERNKIDGCEDVVANDDLIDDSILGCIVCIIFALAIFLVCIE